MLQRVGIAREGVCPEDPRGVDRHVALVPKDARRLVDAGCHVAVEEGAGLRLGFSDHDYKQAGAVVEPRERIYREKDLIVRVKGPANDAITEMEQGSTLFCMAHLPMYPDRRKLLEDQQVNVVAMEAVSHHPFKLQRVDLAPKVFAKQVFDRALKGLAPEDRHVVVVGYSKVTDGFIRYLGRKQLGSLTIIPPDLSPDQVLRLREGAILLTDEQSIPQSGAFNRASIVRGHTVFDFTKREIPHAQIRAEEFFAGEKLPEFGPRRIQALHETGRAGAQFGVEVLRNDSPKGRLNGNEAPAIVLGYGNVAMGAIDQCLREGLMVSVLGRYNTKPERIEGWLEPAKLVINGAFIPDELAGIEYVVTNRHVQEVMAPGTVLIDLIGGSPTDRSPVEIVDTCTFLSDPMFEAHGVKVASVFAWPNFYRSSETCLRYSGQIADVLTQQDGLLQGATKASAGIRRALVLGPFSKRSNGV